MHFCALGLLLLSGAAFALATQTSSPPPEEAAGAVQEQATGAAPPEVHVETQKQSFLSCVDSLMGSLNNEQTHQVHHILAAADAAGIEPHQLRQFFAYAFRPSESGMLRIKAGRRGGKRRGWGRSWDRYEPPPVRRRRNAPEEPAAAPKPFCARCQILKDIRMGKRARVYKLQVIPGSTITPPPNRGQTQPTTSGSSSFYQQVPIEAASIRAQNIHVEKSREPTPDSEPEAEEEDEASAEAQSVQNDASLISN